MSGILTIDNYKADPENKRKYFINYISKFINKDSIQCNNTPISNLPESKLLYNYLCGYKK